MIPSLTKVVAKGESKTLESKRSTGELREADHKTTAPKVVRKPAIVRANTAITTARFALYGKPLPRIEGTVRIAGLALLDGDGIRVLTEASLRMRSSGVGASRPSALRE